MITLEAIVDDCLYIWIAFFHMSSCNSNMVEFEVLTIPEKMASGDYTKRTEYTIYETKRNKP